MNHQSQRSSKRTAVFLVILFSIIAIPICTIAFYGTDKIISTAFLFGCAKWVVPCICLVMCTLEFGFSFNRLDNCDSFYFLEKLAAILYALFLAEATLEMWRFGFAAHQSAFFLLSLVVVALLVLDIFVVSHIPTIEADASPGLIAAAAALAFSSLFCFAIFLPLLLTAPPQPSIGLLAFSLCFFLLSVRLAYGSERS